MHPCFWTPDEDAIVRRMYNRYPQASISASIHRQTGKHRTPEAIRVRANKIGAHGDRIPRGYTRLVDAHDKNHGGHTGASVTITRAARAAGVLKQAHHVRGKPYIAPTAWVEAWLEDHYRLDLPAQEQADTDVLDWIPTRRVDPGGWMPTPRDRLWVNVVAYAPDRRRRDLDGLLKALLDSLCAPLSVDDAQIDQLTIVRGHVDRENPRVRVRLGPMPEREAIA